MKPTHSLPIKLTAVVLFVVLSLCFLITGGAAAYLALDGYYDGQNTDYSQSALCRRQMRQYCFDALTYYRACQDGEDEERAPYRERLDPANTNFRYQIADSRGRVLSDNLGGASLAPGSVTVLWNGDSQRQYEITGFILQPMAAEDGFHAAGRLFGWFNGNRNLMIPLAAVSALLCVILFVFLLCAAGRHSDSPQPRPGVLDRIPFDIYVAVSGFMLWGLASVAVWGGGDSLGYGTAAFALILVAAAWVLAALVALALCMTFAARIKLKTLWSNTVTARLLKLAWRALCWLGRGIREIWMNLRLLWRYVLSLAGLGLAEGILFSSRENPVFALLFVVGNLVLFVVLLRAVLQMDQLRAQADRLAAGDLSAQADVKRMLPSLRQHGESLNRIGLGMGRALEERMKSERMKTDLITNVSHDLKTPLTSIVSYVDLLKKENLTGGKAAEYVAVLDRQSQRLKKLTEDLVEASKASSGTISVHLEPVEAAETMMQCLAEYQDRFAAAQLTAVTELPQGSVRMLSDGRLIWRVVDNLLSNVVKYSLPGTRVYCAVARQEDKALLTVKNISKEPLNIPAAELTERFVRGDQSRSTDGSGLGLSIARSLTELMGGELLLTIDGDLFTAGLRFPLVQPGTED